MIDVKLYTTTDEMVWNQFIISCRNAVFFHHRNYLSYHQDRFEECSLMFLKKNKPIAIFPATVKENIVMSHGGLTFAGLLMHYDLKSNEVLEIFSMLKSFYKNCGFNTIIYKAVPVIFQKYPAQEDLYALFRNEAILVRRDLSTCIYIPEQIRFSETKRQVVRKCLEKNVIVKENTDYTDYWKLLTAVVGQHKTMPTHTLEEIQLLNKRFPENVKLFEARLEGSLLAGVVVFEFGKTIHTQYMANSEEGRKTGVLDYIIHCLVTEIYAHKSYLNFGISTEQAGRYLNEGLVLQKELLGGRGVIYDHYEMILS